MANQNKPSSIAVIGVMLGFILLIRTCNSCDNGNETKNNQSVAANSPGKPSNSPTFDMNGKQATPSVSQASLTSMPGIEFTDVTLNLQRSGYTVQDILKPNYCFWDCKKENDIETYEVTVQGTDPAKIQEVYATYTIYENDNDNGINETAKKFLGYIATLPYTNSNPQAAKEWVYKHIGINHAKTTIGGISFQINAPSTMRRSLGISVPELEQSATTP